MVRKKPAKNKLEVVFDAKKRREFLTGFQKRKNERRKRAQQQLERSIKEERKRIRQEVKDGLKHMKKSFEPLRELTEEDRAEEKEYEDDDVKVRIVELSTNELAAQSNMLGNNEEAESSDMESLASADEGEKTDVNSIPGMDLVEKTTKKKGKRAKTDDKSAEVVLNKKSKRTEEEATVSELKSKKDLNRLMKKKTLNKLHKSKIIKQKELVDKKANRKKVRRNQNNMLRSLPKHVRKTKKFEPSRFSKGRMLNRKQMRKKKESYAK